MTQSQALTKALHLALTAPDDARAAMAASQSAATGDFPDDKEGRVGKVGNGKHGRSQELGLVMPPCKQPPCQTPKCP